MSHFMADTARRAEGKTDFNILRNGILGWNDEYTNSFLRTRLICISVAYDGEDILQ